MILISNLLALNSYTHSLLTAKLHLVLSRIQCQHPLIFPCAGTSLVNACGVYLSHTNNAVTSQTDVDYCQWIQAWIPCSSQHFSMLPDDPLLDQAVSVYKIIYLCLSYFIIIVCVFSLQQFSSI